MDAAGRGEAVPGQGLEFLLELEHPQQVAGGAAGDELGAFFLANLDIPVNCGHLLMADERPHVRGR